VHGFFFECPWCGIDCADSRHEQLGDVPGRQVNPEAAAGLTPGETFHRNKRTVSDQSETERY